MYLVVWWIYIPVLIEWNSPIQVAQLVERRTDNLKGSGSRPNMCNHFSTLFFMLKMMDQPRTSLS